MSLSAAALGSIINSNLTSAGAVGSNRLIFSNAVALGIINSIVGKSFTTTDVGTVPGTGIGSGTGILGLNSASMVTTSLGFMPSTGVNAVPMFQAIHNAVVSHLSSSAKLVSNHSPVFAGTGTVVVGSITVNAVQMANNIATALSNAGAVGVNRMVISNAIAQGVVAGILSGGTGTVTISGSPSGTPAPGGGSGTGVIS